MEAYKVLIADSDPMLQMLYEGYIRDERGFITIKCVSSKEEMMAVLRCVDIDVIVMDIYLNGLNTLSGLAEMHTEFPAVGCIVASVGDDASLVQQSLRLGVFEYLAKPFKQEQLQQALYNFRVMKNNITGVNQQLRQEDVDAFVATENKKRMALHAKTLPRGLNIKDLNDIETLLWSKKRALSALEVAKTLKKSRATARRYLEFLTAAERVETEQIFNKIGRPQKCYRMKVI